MSSCICLLRRMSSCICLIRRMSSCICLLRRRNLVEFLRSRTIHPFRGSNRNNPLRSNLIHALRNNFIHALRSNPVTVLRRESRLGESLRSRDTTLTHTLRSTLSELLRGRHDHLRMRHHGRSEDFCLIRHLSLDSRHLLHVGIVHLVHRLHFNEDVLLLQRGNDLVRLLRCGLFLTNRLRSPRLFASE